MNQGWSRRAGDHWTLFIRASRSVLLCRWVTLSLVIKSSACMLLIAHDQPSNISPKNIFAISYYTTDELFSKFCQIIRWAVSPGAKSNWSYLWQSLTFFFHPHYQSAYGRPEQSVPVWFCQDYLFRMCLSSYKLLMMQWTKPNDSETHQTLCRKQKKIRPPSKVQIYFEHKLFQNFYIFW